MSPTPEQWDPIPEFKGRARGPGPNELAVSCEYPDHDLRYRIEIQPEANGFRLAVQLDQQLPKALNGKAGFNLEFLPSSYFGKSILLNDEPGIIPRHPDGPMKMDSDGFAQPLPLSIGQRIVLAPEDPLLRVAISSDGGPLMLYDGRSKAQNGWFVVRTLIPAGKTKDVVVWVIQGWTRPPVVACNQVGYTSGRDKIAVFELDPLYKGKMVALSIRAIRFFQRSRAGDLRNRIRRPRECSVPNCAAGV